MSVGDVLGDAQCCVSVPDGREGMSRSLGSVYGGAMTLFLRGPSRGLQGQPSRVIALLPVGVGSHAGCWLAVCRDHSTLLHTSVMGLHAVRGVCSIPNDASTLDRVWLVVGAVDRCSSVTRCRCGSRLMTSCSSRTTATTACRCRRRPSTSTALSVFSDTAVSRRLPTVTTLPTRHNAPQTRVRQVKRRRNRPAS